MTRSRTILLAAAALSPAVCFHLLPALAPWLGLALGGTLAAFALRHPVLPAPTAILPADHDDGPRYLVINAGFFKDIDRAAAFARDTGAILIPVVGSLDGVKDEEVRP